MTAALQNNDNSSNNLRIAITGTVVVHALLFLLLAWIFAKEAALKLWQEAHQPPKEKEVMLIFPDQLIPPPLEPPPPPPPQVKKPQVYIRTAQNESAPSAPKNAPFISDRNTTAATTKAPSPDATEPLPSMDGIKLQMRELADRDFHDGELKDDARPKTQPPDLVMRPPQPMIPPAPPTQKPEPKPAQPESKEQKPTPQTVAKTTPTPLTKMMEELANVEENRLPLEVKKPEKQDKDTPPDKTSEAPPKAIPLDPLTLTPVPPKPEMAQSTPPETPPQKPIPKALPVTDDEPVTRTTPHQDPNAFTPFTRKSQTKGTVATRGLTSSVDAADTAVGRYSRQVTGQIEKKWHLYLHLRRDGATYGNLDIVFYVNKTGKVEGLRIVNDKESNTVLTELTVRAIQDAEIPPIPPEVIREIPEEDHGRFKVNYDVHIY